MCMIGTTSVIRKYPKLSSLDNCGEVIETKTNCNKDTGETKKSKNGQKEYGCVLVVVATYKCGSHYISK